MKKNKIAGIYKITNIITGDFYIGSSRDIKHRWARHRCVSEWAQRPNSKLYQAIIQYGLNNFLFEIIEETDNLHEREQYFIDLLHPTYNRINANGIDIKKQRKRVRKASNKFYNQLVSYQGKVIKLSVLKAKFRKLGIPHATQEARKYIIKNEDN